MAGLLTYSYFERLPDFSYQSTVITKTDNCSLFTEKTSGKSIVQNMIGIYSSGTVADFHGIPF